MEQQHARLVARSPASTELNDAKPQCKGAARPKPKLKGGAGVGAAVGAGVLRALASDDDDDTAPLSPRSPLPRAVVPWAKPKRPVPANLDRGGLDILDAAAAGGLTSSPATPSGAKGLVFNSVVEV